MKCAECDEPLMVAGSKFSSEVGSTEVFLEQTLVCVNPKCGSFSGPDLNNPKTVAEVIRSKVN